MFAENVENQLSNYSEKINRKKRNEKKNKINEILNKNKKELNPISLCAAKVRKWYWIMSLVTSLF